MSTVIGSAASAVGSGTPTQLSRSDGSGLDQDAFLKLLMAQMQNQDPLAPTDSSQMMSQMAQFTSVEQLTKLTSSITALQLGQDFTGSVALIGKSVTYRGADGKDASGVVTSVKPSPTGSILTIGDKQVASGDIVSVTDPAAPPAAS